LASFGNEGLTLYGWVSGVLYACCVNWITVGIIFILKVIVDSVQRESKLIGGDILKRPHNQQNVLISSLKTKRVLKKN
jgi:hypothetical protein